MNSKTPSPSLPDQKLSAEIEKLRIENAQLRISAWRTPAFLVPAVGLVISLLGNGQQFLAARQSAAEATRKMELAEMRWKTEKEKLTAETSLSTAQGEQIEVSLAKDAPSFSVSYVSMTLAAYSQLIEAETATNSKKKPVSLFPGLHLYQNSLHQAILKDSISEPDFTKADIRGGGNLEYFKELAAKHKLPVEQKVSCLLLRLEGSRSARNVWLDARQIKIPGAASLPQELYSPTTLLGETFSSDAKPIRIGLGDVLPGKGYIIPLFVAVSDFNSRIAFGTAFVPIRINFVDPGKKQRAETSQEIRPMEPNPFMIEGGVEYAG